LFTEVTLPVLETIKDGATLNTAKIVFTAYKEDGNKNPNAPSSLLMVRKKDTHRFFLKNELNDGKSSYLTVFNKGNNQYEFNNIANLLRMCYEEYMEGTASDPDWETKNPDWNKVVLIPVKTSADSNGYVVKITHDTDIKSIKLRGGEEGYKIPIETISSKFND
jgi:hypothetical protein